jgi:hypothetical protein
LLPIPLQGKRLFNEFTGAEENITDAEVGIGTYERDKTKAKKDNHELN